MANTQEKWQEIANRGLQDRFDPQTRAKFDEAVRRGLITTQQPAQPQTIPQPVAQPATAQAEPSFGQQALGTLENVGALVSGAVAEPLAGLAGIGALLPGGQTPTEAIESTREALTFQPRTEIGQAQQQVIGETLAPVGEALSSAERFLGEGALELTGSPAIATVAHAIPTVIGEALGLKGLSKLSGSKSPLAQKIASEPTPNIQKSFTKKLGNDRFSPRIFGMVKEARKQGFDEGMTTVIANASPIDKRRMLQMVNTLEKGKADSLFEAKNRPADIAGDSLLRKVDFVKSNNKQAGQQLNRVAKSLKGKEVDIADPINKFFDDAKSIGVTFSENGKPIFEGSQIETIAPAKKLIKDISLRIKRQPTPDALQAHQFKKFIDENVTFGKVAQGLGGKTERIAKDLRKGVNNTLGGQFDKYKEANTRFADTIQALDSLQDAAGKKIDFFGPNADKATGTVLRRLMSNAQGRVTLMDAIDNIETTAKRYGGSFDDDILTQMLFADELDSIFGSGARTSLKGEVKKAGVESAIDISQMTIPGALATGAKAGARRLRGINEKNQLKAIKNLLRIK